MRFTVSKLPALFVAALAIRFTYSGLLYYFGGESPLLGVDSADYIMIGRGMAERALTGNLDSWDLFGPRPVMMPLFTWLLVICAWISTSHAAFLYVLLQGVLDAGTCIIVYRITALIDPRASTAASIAAIINPTQIVMAGLVYPDTPFVFFVALILWGVLSWLREPRWVWALFVGLAFVLAAWIRVLIVPFAVATMVFLLAVMLLRGTLRRTQILQLSVALALFFLSLTPILLRNGFAYGSYSLTSQGGLHLARWVVPLVWEVRDGTLWMRGYEEMERRAGLLPQPAHENPFEQSRRYTQVAMEELSRIGTFPIIKAWIFGAAINLGTPAVI
ncbi:MAG: glycosyltransferase family 39 protein, partial [Pseudorhodoplanes sp.]|nr:glycosyltransferase family 39 protein [Pseudorhodoplanes sp.]